jgi:hypothetical protein
MLDLVGLTEREAGRRIRNYSLGMSTTRTTFWKP